MKKTPPNIIFQKEAKYSSEKGLGTVFVIPKKKNHQTPIIPIQLEFWGVADDKNTYLLINPWIQFTIFSRTSNQITLVEEGLPLPVSSGNFKNGSGGILKGNLLIWETRIHLNAQLQTMIERIFDPQFGLVIKADWGATVMDLANPQNAFAEIWFCKLRITPNKWEDFSYLWK